MKLSKLIIRLQQLQNDLCEDTEVTINLQEDVISAYITEDSIGNEIVNLQSN